MIYYNSVVARKLNVCMYFYNAYQAYTYVILVFRTSWFHYNFTKIKLENTIDNT